MTWGFCIHSSPHRQAQLKCTWISIVIRSAVDLAYKAHGTDSKGPPVIVIHGLLGSKKNWESMAKKIASATKKTVIAVDARNHGESPHSNSHTYPELASDVSQLIDKLSTSTADIIGHSMGGRTGMVLALTEPKKVNSLVVVDISPVSTAGILNNFFPKLIDVMKSVDLKGANDLSTARAKAKDTLINSGLFKPDDNIRFIIMNIGKRPDETIGWNCNLETLKRHFKDIATFPSELTGKQYLGRTLFIGGEQSNYIPPTDLPGIKKFFPQAQLEVVSGVGHNVHAEDPSNFLSIVTKFLAEK